MGIADIKWAVWYRAHGPRDSMFQGRSAILWRLAEWTSFGPDDARSIWVQPEHFKPEKHELLKFTSKEDVEQ